MLQHSLVGTCERVHINECLLSWTVFGKHLFRLSYVLVLTRNRTVCGFFIIVSLNCGICSRCWGLSPNKRQLQALLVSPGGDSEYKAFCPYCVPLRSITTSLVIPSATVSPSLLTWMLKKAFPSHIKRLPV